MNFQQMKQILIDSEIEPNEAEKELKIFCEDLFGYKESDKIKGKTLTDQEYKLLEEKVKLRAETKKPIQYILEKAWFMGEYYKVTPDVLIPRDETEISVRKAINIINENNFKSVLDIGTGSGCIACSIAKNSNAVVLGVDISSDALMVALDNVTKLEINNKAVFRKSNLFSAIREDEKFDLIISNPPYIPIGTPLQKEVTFEPEIALFAEENGLEFYRKIVEQAPGYLNIGGYLIFELGIGEAKEVKNFMENEFKNIEIIKDMTGIERVIVGKYI